MLIWLRYHLHPTAQGNYLQGWFKLFAMRTLWNHIGCLVMSFLSFNPSLSLWYFNLSLSPPLHPVKSLGRHMCVALLSHFSRVQLFPTLWTVARQGSLSMGFSRQEYCSGWSFPLPGGLNPGIEPVSPALAGGFVTTELSGKSYIPVSLLMSISLFREINVHFSL